MRRLRHPWVLFDAGGTLFGPSRSYGAVYAQVLAERGVDISAEMLDFALEEHWGAVDRTIPRGSDRYSHYPGGEREYWLRFVEGTFARVPGVPGDPSLAEAVVDPIRDAFRRPDAWSVFDDVEPALRELTGMGARLAIVSNWDSRLPALLVGLGLARWFGAVAVSHEIGYEKPRPEPFAHALAALGGTPERALHVGDSPELDGDGARAAGIACIIVDRRGRAGGASRSVKDLSALPAIARDGSS